MPKRYLGDNGVTQLIKNMLALAKTKENVIEDLEVIRAGSKLGTTSIQKHQDISGKADKSTTLAGYGIEDAYTKEEIDALVSSVFAYKGSVETVDELPEENNVGDVWEVKAENANYSWTGTEWTVLGALVDISNKADKGTTLAEYNIADAYTKDELSAIINNNNPIIEEHKSYIVKGGTAFYNYQQATVNLYLMERTQDGFHGLNPLGGSGLFVVNNTSEDMVLILTARNYNGYALSRYKYGYANGDASASDINYSLSGSGTVLSGSGSLRGESTIPLVIPAGMKGYFINSGWDHESGTEGPLEITECYSNDVFEVNENFQGMTIKTEALLPTPVILTQEEYDAIEPKKSTCMYYIIEE